MIIWRLKQAISNHKEETIAIGALVLGLLIVGTSCYKLGYNSAWPPKHLDMQIFQRGTEQFMVLNGTVFTPTK